MQQDRVARAKRSEPRWDVGGVYAEKCAELARDIGKPPHVVWEEFCERSGCRVFVSGQDVETAEACAFEDVLERFRV